MRRGRYGTSFLRVWARHEGGAGNRQRSRDHEIAGAEVCIVGEADRVVSPAAAISVEKQVAAVRVAENAIARYALRVRVPDILILLDVGTPSRRRIASFFAFATAFSENRN